MKVIHVYEVCLYVVGMKYRAFCHVFLGMSKVTKIYLQINLDPLLRWPL
jgi:hypothetical protein